MNVERLRRLSEAFEKTRPDEKTRNKFYVNFDGRRFKRANGEIIVPNSIFKAGNGTVYVVAQNIFGEYFNFTFDELEKMEKLPL